VEVQAWRGSSEIRMIKILRDRRRFMFTLSRLMFAGNRFGN